MVFLTIVAMQYLIVKQLHLSLYKKYLKYKKIYKKHIYNGKK